MNRKQLDAAYEFRERVGTLRILWNSDANAEATAAAGGELLEMFGPLIDDELAVVGLLVARLVEGWETYGRLKLKHDPRDFLWEMLEEQLDATAWGSMQILRAYVSTPARGDDNGVSAPRVASPLAGLEVDA